MVLSLSVLSKSIERLTDRGRKVTTSHTLKYTGGDLDNDFKEFFADVSNDDPQSCPSTATERVVLQDNGRNRGFLNKNCTITCEEHICDVGFSKTYTYACCTNQQTTKNPPNCASLTNWTC